MAQHPKDLTIHKAKQRKLAALFTGAGSLVTLVAALSDNIARALGISVRSLLAVDIAFAGAIFVLVLWRSRA